MCAYLKTWCVYVHIFPNGKMYFGITSKKPKDRWENGTGYSRSHQPVMYNAIQKYGWENIEHKILYSGLNKLDAENKEKELIAQHKTNCCRYGDDFGYNMTDGGEGNSGRSWSEDARRRMSENMMGKRKGKYCYKSKAVICDGVIYESVTEFAEKNNVSRGALEKWLRGKSAMPEEWYDKGLRLVNQEAKITKQDKKWQNPIYYDGNIFKSQAAFAEYIGVDPALVCRWIKNNKIPQKYIEKGFKRIE